MPTLRFLAAAAAAMAATATMALAAPVAAIAERPPTAAGGQPAQLVATGLATPTAFAFGPHGVLFAGDAGGDHQAGGLFVLRHGVAQRLGGAPALVAGVAWHAGKLYVSGDSVLEAWSGWNGRAFTARRVLYRAPARFPGFNGLAFGPGGRIYAGVQSTTDDHGPTGLPYARDILSFTAGGGDLRVYARGIRQPWQLAFAPGSSAPFVSDLGQDGGAGASTAPDFILRVRAGQNYGFPRCNWVAPCHGAARPFEFLAPHTDPMGIAVLGDRLYIAEFGGSAPPEVASMPQRGGALRPLLTGFSNAVLAVGAHAGWVYAGDRDGDVWRVRP